LGFAAGDWHQSAGSSQTRELLVGMINNTSTSRNRFPLGQVVSTPGALDAFAKSGELAQTFLNRHVTGDFGTVCEKDRQANEDAIADGGRVFSVYLLKDQTKIWIITEADRSSTCILLPDEY
jgi:hypothetical protein